MNSSPEEPEVLDVVAVGEGQLRLTSPLGSSLEGAAELSVHVAGTEGNVLGLLARLGNRTALVSALPDNPLGRRVASTYREAGVGTSLIAWSETGRVATYFLEQGSPPVPSRVLYDREGSCFARLRAEDVDWDAVAQARLVHGSGITAALTDSTYELVSRAIDTARAHGRLVSFDVNHRTRLWDSSVARERLAPLLAQTDVLFCSCRDAELLFDLSGDSSSVALALSERFGAATVLVSDGPRAVAVVADGVVDVVEPPETAVVDRVGAGDALLGAFLHGLLAGDAALGARLGVAAASLALTRYGDQVHTTLEELLQLSASLGCGPDIER